MSNLNISDNGIT